jgi:NAD(P)-dependent dehydrogenase (short-subunit alcohol dehydrogenase family)
MGIEGQVAVIAGGEGALGRAVTQEFLSRGAKVFVGWNSEEEWVLAEALIPVESKDRLADARVDLTQEDQVVAFIEKAKQRFGTVDVLLHMVGMISIGPPLWETETAVVEKLIDTNLKSAFLCAKHALKTMIEKNSGRIFFFPASVVLEPKPGFGAYAISKSGLLTLTEALREELKDTDITVNSVMFSVLDTPKTRKMPHAQPEKYVAPAEVAKLLAALCSDGCGALSGSVLKLYGKL